MEERIKEVMEYLGLSQQEFAQKLGISPASLSNIFNGRSKPTNNHVQAIHRAFPSISTNWLMFGEGVMFGDNGDKSPNDMCGSSSNVTPNIQGAENAVSKKNMDGMELFSNLSDSAGGNQNRERQAAAKVITETKIIRPKILEIRVFYDDQTFESFVPSEKRNVSR